MPLSSEPSRPLTSRDIARIIASVYGGFISHCDIEEVIGAFDHFVEHQDEYRQEFRMMSANYQAFSKQMLKRTGHK